MGGRPSAEIGSGPLIILRTRLEVKAELHSIFWPGVLRSSSPRRLECSGHSLPSEITILRVDLCSDKQPPMLDCYGSGGAAARKWVEHGAALW
jgi:hypothetical protein